MRLKLAAAFFLAATFLPADFVPTWNEPIPPYRVISNIYYVGTNYLASFLITSSAGHILINPDFEQSVPVIQKSVEQLGFKFSDIKIILISHAHDDHAAGCALAKKLSGARLMVMAGDAAEVASGGEGDFQYTQHWTPVKVDRILKDGDKVQLGDVVLTAHLTPGHTKGCTTWTMEAIEGGRPYHVVVIGSPNINPGYKLVDNAKYPGIAADYERTFRVLKSLPCDIFLGAHGAYYGMDEKLKRLKDSAANPFLDPAGYQAYVKEREETFRKELAKQQAAKRFVPATRVL